ncbi:hypothetical protein BgiMline_020929, partial [Biomphalaria glabrata]
FMTVMRIMSSSSDGVPQWLKDHHTCMYMLILPVWILRTLTFIQYLMVPGI